MRTLDSLDLALLQKITSSARASHVELGKAVGLSTTACARRLAALEEDGFIVGYHAALGLGALGLGTTVIVRITLDGQSEDALKAFETAVKKCPSVIRCLLMSGSDDYLLTIAAGGIEDYERIHTTQLSRLPKVARIHSSFAIRTIVERQYPLAGLADAERRRRHAAR